MHVWQAVVALSLPVVLVIGTTQAGFAQQALSDEAYESSTLQYEQQRYRSHSSTSLKDVLDTDGALKPGSQGTFTGQGYRMAYAADGSPRFTAAIEGEGWQSGFDYTGLNGHVREIAVDGSDVYIAGEFENAGGITEADHIARWDGTRWHALGSGLNGKVNVIVLHNGLVYVGGSFTDAGGDAEADALATWDGGDWRAVPGANTHLFDSPQNTNIRALVFHEGDLYVGGRFWRAGGDLKASYIARWDGTRWHALGEGIVTSSCCTTTVRTVLSDGENLYAGGEFSGVGGVDGADNIARWDGTNWHALGSGLNERVFSLVSYEGAIYAGGWFTDAAGITEADYIARWKDEQWQQVGPTLNSSVQDMVVLNGKLYVGGGFSDVGGDPSIDYVMRWGGDQWEGLQEGASDVVLTIAAHNEEIYIGGIFVHASSGLQTAYLACWTEGAQMWEGIDSGVEGNGLNAVVRAIAVSGTDVYVGGDFVDAGGVEDADNLARWDGTQWHAVGGGLNARVLVLLATPDVGVYVGGAFTNAGGLDAADYLARWDGTQWHAVGPGIGDSVHAFATQGDDLYVGGSFRDAGGLSNADYIARWDGTTWHALGTGVDRSVRALAFMGQDLYVGGLFAAAGGVSAQYLARWDGDAWHAVDIPLTLFVWALAVAGTDLYIGGPNLIEGRRLYPESVIRWDGDTWHYVGEPTVGWVYALDVHNNDLYIGGSLIDYEEQGTLNNIVRWDGSQLHDVGGGFAEFSTVRALAIQPTTGSLFMGGEFFETADRQVQSTYFAQFVDSGNLLDTSGLATLPVEHPFGAITAAYPMPVRDRATLQISVDEPQYVEAILYDIMGREIARPYQSWTSPGQNQEITVAATPLPSGTYVLRVVGESFVEDRSIIVVK
ncbi:MAG: T9SS type A sorting domain-containing protein [Bacteroidota bacterium]